MSTSRESDSGLRKGVREVRRNGVGIPDADDANEAPEARDPQANATTYAVTV